MRLFFVVLLVLLLANAAFATVLEEVPFNTLGHEDFIIEGTNQSNCTEIEFFNFSDLNNAINPVLSLHVEFLPIQSKDSQVTIFLNSQYKELAELRGTDFHDGWARVEVDNNKLMEKNMLKVCGKTSQAVTGLQIKSDSLIGFYLKPDFRKENAFTLSVPEKSIKLGEEFEVKATLHNYGEVGTALLLKYRREELERETPETELVRGDTRLDAFVPKCSERDSNGACISPGEIEFSYFLRPEKAGQISLLPSIAEYTNIFGETEVIESDRPNIFVEEPEKKIRAFIRLEKGTYNAGESADFTLIVSNISTEPVPNVGVFLNAFGLEVVQGKRSETIELLQPKESIERSFKVTSNSSGKFDVGCKITYLEEELIESECLAAPIEFKEKSIDLGIVAGAFLFIVGAAVFIYIMSRKE